MLTKYIFGPALFFIMPGPLLAQQVELIQFGARGDDFVIHVGSPPPAGDAAVVDDTGHLSATLATDFAMIGASQPDHMAPLPASIDVPEWMRTGIRSSALRSGEAFLHAIPVGCGSVQYLPRADLPASTELRRAKLFPLIAAVACEQRIPVGLFDALIAQESRYQQNALSPKGAIGLAQLMPGTADYLGVSNPWDVTENLRGGARYLREQIEEFGRYDLALAAYNAGPGRVRAHRRIPRIRETLEYVRVISAAWASHERRSSFALAPSEARFAISSRRTASVSSYTSTSVAKPR
jgi:hypothetical protein